MVVRHFKKTADGAVMDEIINAQSVLVSCFAAGALDIEKSAATAS
jgi:hypothetical protein